MNDHPDMPDTQTLVQRFVDQELSHEERVRFLVQIGRDEGLRRQALAIEHVALSASRLTRPALPADFVADVMRRIDSRPSMWRRAADVLWRPRPFQWNLAGAVAASLALLIAGSAGWGVLVRRVPDSGPSSDARQGASPVVVRLVVLRPGAQTVQVAGDFNGWDPTRTPLEPLASGAWAVTLPLEPGRYKDMFVVDGSMWVADPFAAEEADDGFGARNAVLDVRSPGGAPL